MVDRLPLPVTPLIEPIDDLMVEAAKVAHRLTVGEQARAHVGEALAGIAATDAMTDTERLLVAAARVFVASTVTDIRARDCLGLAWELARVERQRAHRARQPQHQTEPWQERADLK